MKIKANRVLIIICILSAINAISFSHEKNPNVPYYTEREAAHNLKRTWVNNGRTRDWSKTDAESFLRAATEVKNIWVPYGE